MTAQENFAQAEHAHAEAMEDLRRAVEEAGRLGAQALAIILSEIEG